MDTKKHLISPPSLEELADKLEGPLARNFEQASVDVVSCPDLRDSPFYLASEGLTGQEKIGDIGGQPNLFPTPLLDKVFPLPKIAEAMEMSSQKGSLLGASAGIFNSVGQNAELCPSFSWEEGLKNVQNKTRFAHLDNKDSVCIKNSPTHNCAIMANLFGSLGEPGPVLRISVRGRKGPERSFTECIQKALYEIYGGNRTISLGGTFLIKSGRAKFHVMPEFPAEGNIQFKDFKDFTEFLTYHDCEGPIVCLAVVNSADPGNKIGLKLDHAHGVDPMGKNGGGHYHYDVDGDDIEYEGYFNTANVIYRIDPPSTTLERDLCE